MPKNSAIIGKRIYLDYASTTPLDPKVFAAMKPYLAEYFVNPSSLYDEGVKMRKVMEQSRKDIATILCTLPAQIFFTGSGTEANNMAILGTFYYFKFKKGLEKPHFVTSAIEHPSVLEPFRTIERLGGEVTYILPESDGRIDEKKIKENLKKNTVLVSIIYANNEIGTVNPMKDIAKVIRAHRKNYRTDLPYFHTDASQAANYLDCNVTRLNVDMMTLDASKIYGPKGIGMLFKKSNVELEPIMYGGSQEKGLRPGTENVAAIVGLRESLKIAETLKEKESNRLTILRDNFIQKITEIPGCSLNGSEIHRLPNNINICIDGLNAEYAVFLLDAQGFLVSSVTSCRNLAEESSSYVIESLGKSAGKSDCSSSSLRITLGRQTTQKHLHELLKILPQIIDKAKKN